VEEARRPDEGASGVVRRDSNAGFRGDESDRWGWFFFRAPDGNIDAIQQDGLTGDATRD